LRGWFEANPQLRMPPVIAVVTHIDLLSPSLEWAPPYNWQEPTRPKEKNIREAVTFVREQFGARVAQVVPVCAAPGKVHGVQEWVLPAILQVLGEARGVALLRCLNAEANRDRFRKIFDQMMTSGKQLAKIVWEGVRSGALSGKPPY